MLIDRQTLFGIGIGLLLAAALLALGGGRAKPPTDVEVVSRARALGMVFPGEERLKMESSAPPEPPAGSPGKEALVSGEKTGGKARSTVTVVIPPGATAGDVARLLREKSLIADDRAFLQIAAERQAVTRFKPGIYRFPSNITVREVIEALVAGPPAR